MTADVLSPNTKSLQPLKKRKIQRSDTMNNDLENNVQTIQETQNNTECTSKENKDTLMPNVILKNSPITKHSSNESIKIENMDTSQINMENANIIGTYNNNSVIENDNQNSRISICKLEDLRCTPTKKTELNEFIDVQDIKTENVNSPDIFSPSSSNINTMECYPRYIKMLQETPTSCEKENYYANEYNTPSKRKKRKLSDVSDCDQISDMLKSELYDTNFADMEPIDMLHDLSSVIDFEETKISSEFLSSVANDEQNEHNMEMSKDPQMDPLFIANSDVHNTNNEDIDNKYIKKTTMDIHHSGEDLTTEYSDETENEDEDESRVVNDEIYDTLKIVLGELNIQSDSENEQKLEDAKKRLYELKVQLIHNIPPQHKIETTAGSRALSRTERQLFLSYGPIKNGVFSPAEDKIIKNNWKKFCEIHNWDLKYTEPFLCMRKGKRYCIRNIKERQKFVQFIANGLPWRTLYSVYNRFKNIHDKYEKTFKRYTVNEDEQILLFMKNKRTKRKYRKHKFCDLAKSLGRTSHSVWLRYQLLKKMQESHTEKPLSEVKWTLPLIGKFIKTIMNVTLSEKLEDLKDATLPKPIWLKLEEKLNIDHNVLKVLWMHQLHMQLFCLEPIYLNDMKIKLIEYIYEKGIAHTREIIWPNVAKYFEGVTTVFLCKVFFYLVKEATMKIGKQDFLCIVDYLYNHKIPDIKNELTDKFLPRLSYNDGTVEIIDQNADDNNDT
ncbi:uncharacterized protein LOC143343606 isoform X1 [Colletes latitarsis]|uniref:uncharacterized protein LOC143343606 isoform X1 n=1 Tax=Colletes latitarsis TaxID=2605962 RepID=UPI0040369BDF